LEIIDSKKVTDFRHLNFFEIDYRDRHGKRRTWQIVSRQAEPKCRTGAFSVPDAVVIVPYHRAKDRLVVIREFRVALGDYQYGFPAGLVDEGEGIATATARELREETGLKMTRLLKSSPPVFSSSGLTDEAIVMVYVECEGEPNNHHNESSEDIQTLFVSPAEAADLCRNSTLKIDVKTWLVLTAFAENHALFV